MGGVKNHKRNTATAGVNRYIRLYPFSGGDGSSFLGKLQKVGNGLVVTGQYPTYAYCARMLIDSNINVQDLEFTISQSGDPIHGIVIDETDSTTEYTAQTITSLPYTATPKKKYIAIGILFYNPSTPPVTVEVFVGSLTVTYSCDGIIASKVISYNTTIDLGGVIFD